MVRRAENSNLAVAVMAAIYAIATTLTNNLSSVQTRLASKAG
jgi:hypothetical protein